MSVKKKYTVELLCDYLEWWRYNVYIMAVGYDGQGGEPTFDNLADRVYDTDGVERCAAPADYAAPRVLRLETRECAFVDIYLYVVANTFPATATIADRPPFSATLRVSVDGKVVSEQPCEVNQWGGATVAGLRVDAAK